jgi:hypothetical protein
MEHDLAENRFPSTDLTPLIWGRRFGTTPFACGRQPSQPAENAALFGLLQGD